MPDKARRKKPFTSSSVSGGECGGCHKMAFQVLHHDFKMDFLLQQKKPQLQRFFFASILIQIFSVAMFSQKWILTMEASAIILKWQYFFGHNKHKIMRARAWAQARKSGLVNKSKTKYYLNNTSESEIGSSVIEQHDTKRALTRIRGFKHQR